MSLEDKYKIQKKIEKVKEMFTAINEAKSVRAINQLRESCVTLMKQDPNVLLAWQKKYQSLRSCPTCGNSR